MKIIAAENGPLLIEVAEVKIIKDGNKEILSQKEIALCRCESSPSKSLCDDAYKNKSS